MSAAGPSFLARIEPLVDRLIGPVRKRRLIHRWFMLRRGMTLGVRAAVLDGAGRVFLVRHAYIEGWHLPGGGVERGQSARAALEAELREEANIELTMEPALFALYHNARAAPRDHVALYIVRAFEQRGERMPDHEILEARFFPLNALPEGVTESTRKRLGEIAGVAPVPPEW